MGYCLVGMVENRKDDCSYPQGWGVGRCLGIVSLGPREGQQHARKGTRCAMYRNRQNRILQESTLCGLCPQLFYLHREEKQCLFKFFLPLRCMLIWLEKGWMMLSERNMMQLPLVPKALPFLTHMMSV